MRFLLYWLEATQPQRPLLLLQSHRQLGLPDHHLPLLPLQQRVPLQPKSLLDGVTHILRSEPAVTGALVRLEERLVAEADLPWW